MIETERKYLIEYPDIDILLNQPECTVGEITQIYLASNDGETRRVRKTLIGETTVYHSNTKTRISPMSSIEDERVISREEFDSYVALERDSTLNIIYKTRYTFYYLGQKFEIDVYPFWSCSAICETELDDESKRAVFPPFLNVIREVTGDKRYSNRAMARELPPEK